MRKLHSCRLRKHKCHPFCVWEGWFDCSKSAFSLWPMWHCYLCVRVSILWVLKNCLLWNKLWLLYAWNLLWSHLCLTLLPVTFFLPLCTITIIANASLVLRLYSESADWTGNFAKSVGIQNDSAWSNLSTHEVSLSTFPWRPVWRIVEFGTQLWLVVAMWLRINKRGVLYSCIHVSLAGTKDMTKTALTGRRKERKEIAVRKIRFVRFTGLSMLRENSYAYYVCVVDVARTKYFYLTLFLCVLGQSI